MMAAYRFVAALSLLLAVGLAMGDLFLTCRCLAQSATAPQIADDRATDTAEETRANRPADSVDEDWAADYLQDPLAATASPTLEMLEAALADPQRWSTVLVEHFPRAAELTEEQQRAFLQQALEHQAFDVRSQAAAELQRRGWLETWLADLLKQLVGSDDEDARRAALLGLGKSGERPGPQRSPRGAPHADQNPVGR